VTLVAVMQTSAKEIWINYADLDLGATIARGGSGIIRRGRFIGRGKTITIPMTVAHAPLPAGVLTAARASWAMCSGVFPELVV
jgi:hypothetical protein